MLKHDWRVLDIWSTEGIPVMCVNCFIIGYYFQEPPAIKSMQAINNECRGDSFEESREQGND